MKTYINKDLQSWPQNSSLSPTYRDSVINVSSHYELQFFHQVAHYPAWSTAIKTKPVQNPTILGPSLLGQKESIPLDANGFKKSSMSDGTIERHKACSVAKGYTQQDGFVY